MGETKEAAGRRLRDALVVTKDTVSRCRACRVEAFGAPLIHRPGCPVLDYDRDTATEDASNG